MVSGWLDWTIVLVLAGCLMSVVWGLLALRHRSRSGTGGDSRRGHPRRDLAWSMFAFNGAPDSMLVLPLAATGVGGLVGFVVGRLPTSWHRWSVLAVAGWVVVALALTLHLTWTSRAPELAAERSRAEALFAALPADATVFAFNAPQPLALTGRESISRYVLFGAGMQEYVASQWNDGFPGLR